MRGRGERARVAALEVLLAEAWTGPAWHGPSLRSIVRGLDAESAWRRPPGASHSPWEILLHLAYWTHRVAGRINGTRDRFARGPRNWPDAPRSADPVRWKEDVALLEEAHAGLVGTAASLTDRDLERRVGRHTVEESLRGIALHDLYHGGQMRMMERMGRR